jgi:hypothetical protein
MTTMDVPGYDIRCQEDSVLNSSSLRKKSTSIQIVRRASAKKGERGELRPSGRQLMDVIRCQPTLSSASNRKNE